ncbi:ribosome biogenesis protein Nop53/GLTSCR2 [Pseudomassariella vexata]|uniref:Ribosome biogenesis protein NOP53 n=1 Tax=Pseudomassariella vexata TaxID=1141098 RepID=A0A1Y2DKP1_9PEZI|nr:ribosome biogenesis protein Nop53/GLTSCR2 [Pseudomassariella vexata]ORY59696.1 ribosome biogenesis protein Nop53/GLTSCR2 [Pseudomassariella vexata]
MPVLEPLRGSADAPATYKQPSRKGKKAWRKNVDVTEVQQGLVELNEEIIKGGVIAERPSEQLFTFDTFGDASIPKKFPKHTSKPLKSEEIIAARSLVPAVDSRKRPGIKTSDGIIPAKRQRTGYVTQKELAHLRRVADGQQEMTVEISDTVFDPWTAAADTPKDPEAVYDFRNDQTKAPKSFAKKPISLAANGKPIPAVARPSGGYSYNPAFDDYEARLTAESKKAIEAEQRRLAEEEAERMKAEAAARSAAEAEAAEARAQLSEWEEDSEWEGFQSDGEELKVSAKQPQRKTPAQRNRIKRRKEEERRLKHESKTKLKKAQAEQIKQIAKALAEREEALALARAEESDSTAEGNDEELRRKQLGRRKLPEKDLELVLPDELEDSLRRLKPEGNLLKDRYRNLLVNGKVEITRRIPFRKQAKMKSTEKWSYKDFRI